MESSPLAGAPANRPARLLLKALVLVGAVAFLITMMINACAHPPEAFYPTKAAPVMRSPDTPRIDPALMDIDDDVVERDLERDLERKDPVPPAVRKPRRRFMPATKAAPAFSPDDEADAPQQAPVPQKQAR